MKLTDVQEEIVRKYVEAQELKLSTLSDDIIDHLCCVLESELGKEKSFDQVLQDAVAELAPNGIRELERNTFHLINSKRIIMKKLTFLMGLTGAMALTGGATFKLLHLPGANQLFMIGYLAFLLVFIPLLAVDRFKVTNAKSIFERLNIILGVVSSVILGLAGAFKIMQLPGDHLLLMCGLIVFAACFLPLLFFTMYKQSIS